MLKSRWGSCGCQTIQVFIFFFGQLISMPINWNFFFFFFSLQLLGWIDSFLYTIEGVFSIMHINPRGYILQLSLYIYLQNYLLSENRTRNDQSARILTCHYCKIYFYYYIETLLKRNLSIMLVLCILYLFFSIFYIIYFGYMR